MTSIAGHIMHLHENLELTFSDLFNVIDLALQGRLENVTEKIDGINIVFSCQPNGELRFGRSKADIVPWKFDGTVGLSATELLQKFDDKGNVKLAFNEGCKTIKKAIDCIPDHERLKIFGPKCNRWFSVEIVYAPLSNTINYDGNYIVFHERPVLELNSGVLAKSQNHEYAKALGTNITAMQNVIKLNGWRVSGPAVVHMKSLNDGSLKERFVSRLNDAMSDANVNQQSTLRDYVQGMAMNELDARGIRGELAQRISERLTKRAGCLNLVALKRMADVNLRDEIDAIVKAENELRKKWLKPIEDCIRELSMKVLEGMSSMLVCNPQSEIRRLKQKLENAKVAIGQCNDDSITNVLTDQMDTLGSLDNISAIEGIVFTYKGETYKFTGAFAPLHKILSLFKYGPLSSIDIDVAVAER